MADDAVLGTLTAKLNLDASAAQAAVGKLAGMFGPLSGAVALLGTAVIGIGALAVGLASKYQDALAMIEGRMGITAAAGEAIGAAFLSTAGKATFSALTIAQAFAPVAGQLDTINGSALSAAQSLAFMNAAMALATATGTDLATATATLAGILQTFGLNLSQATNASDILYNASNALGVPIDALSTSLDRARANAGAAAPSLSDLSTLLLDLAEHGETGRSAMTILGTALTGIEAPTKAVLAAQDKLNVSFLTANGALKPLSTIIAILNPIISKMGDAQATAALKSLGFGSASSKLVGIIDAGLPAWNKANAAVDKSGTVASGASKNTNTLGGAWSKLSSNVSDMLTKAGTPLNTFLTKLVNTIDNDLQPAVNWTISHFGTLKDIIIPLGVAFVGLKLGELAQAMYALGTATTAAAGPWGILAAAVTVAVAGLAWMLTHKNQLFPGGPTLKPLLAGGGGLLGGGLVTPSMSLPLIGGKGLAAGGPISGPRLVGEFGPEVFRPDVSGTIIPNHMLGGAGVTQNIAFYGVGQETVDLVDQRLRANNNRLID